MVNLDLLLCTGFDSEHADSFKCLRFSQGPMNRKIVQSNESCFSLSLVLAKSIEVPFYIKSVKMAQNLLSI